MAKLVVLSEGFAGASYELKSERTTIGRLEDNAFQIPEPAVSGHHCEIRMEGNRFIVKDLDSTNGTYIDDRPVKEAPIRPGQILRLGQVELRLEDEHTPPLQRKKKSAAASSAKSAPPAGGIQPGQLEGQTRVIRPAFEKKDDRANKLFLYGGVALGLAIIVVIIYAIIQLSAGG
ncbi:MAG: FHA domain-containing protein [Verrucomicrobia bacterium]|nr:FHA domain-containing protein [Verrucomicrobiota bacterium]